MKLFLIILASLAILLPGTSPAQSTDEEKPIRLYDVELVIFKNVKAPKSREFILPVSSPGREEKMFDLSSASSVKAAAKMGYRILPAESHRLLEVVDRLIESSRYELLLHAAWRQPGVEREKALPVWLRGGRVYGSEYTSIDNQIELLESIPRSGGDSGSGKKHEFDEQTLEALELQMLEQKNSRGHQGLFEFEGKVTIALGRYLHAYTDLVFRRPRLSADAVASNPVQDQYLTTYAADTRILDNHLLQEHRRMRSKNLHYLDNPEFAMLILITPYEAPAEAAAADNAE